LRCYSHICCQDLLVFAQRLVGYSEARFGVTALRRPEGDCTVP